MIPKWLIKRLLLIVPGLLGVSLITFYISVSIPGDPVYALVGERADPVLIESYRTRLGLDQNLAFRYFCYLKMIFRFDFGKSYYTHQSVSKELLEKFPNTFRLASAAILFAVLSGLLLGGICAVFKDSFFDKLILFVSTGLISLPVFWFGMLLIFIFALHLKWLPSSGMDSGYSIVLPSIALGSRSLGYLVRLTRSCMIEILSSEYILLVRAKGGGTGLILYHAFMNAIIPVVTFIGLDFGSYLNGSVLTETIFGWDGIGRYAMNGILRRDYPVIIGTVLFGAFVFMLVNILIDVFYTFANPKLRRTGL